MSSLLRFEAISLLNLSNCQVDPKEELINIPLLHCFVAFSEQELKNIRQICYAFTLEFGLTPRSVAFKA